MHRYFQHDRHRRWLDEVFSGPGPRWRLPFSHHLAYCAGPHHGNDEEILADLLPLYHRGQVSMVFAGHEHNFQVAGVDGITHVLTGAGGNLREDMPQDFERAHTVAYNVQAHALLVDIDGDVMRIVPSARLRSDGSMHPMSAMTPAGDVVRPPFVVRLPS